jgi:hypothetical protein
MIFAAKRYSGSTAARRRGPAGNASAEVAEGPLAENTAKKQRISLYRALPQRPTGSHKQLIDRSRLQAHL